VFPDGTYLVRGEFPLPRIKSSLSPDTVVGYGRARMPKLGHSEAAEEVADRALGMTKSKFDAMVPRRGDSLKVGAHKQELWNTYSQESWQIRRALISKEATGKYTVIPGRFSDKIDNLFEEYSVLLKPRAGRYPIKVRDIESILARDGITAAIDTYGERAVIKAIPEIKNIIGDTQYQVGLRAVDTNAKRAQILKESFDRANMQRLVDESLEREFVMRYNPESYSEVWDHFQKVVDEYLGLAEADLKWLTESQNSYRDLLVRDLTSKYFAGVPLIDTNEGGTYITFLERSGLIKQIPFRESFSKWWPEPKITQTKYAQQKGFSPFGPGGSGGENLMPGMSLLGSLALGVVNEGEQSYIDASVLTNKQITKLKNKGAIYLKDQQLVLLPVKVKTETTTAFNVRIAAAPGVAPRTIPKIYVKPIPVPRTAPAPTPETVPSPEPGAKPSPIPKPVPAPKPVPVPKPTPVPQPKPEPQPEPQPIPRPIPKPIPSPVPSPVPPPVPPGEPPVKGPPPKKPGGGGKGKLTRAQLAASVAWKQGKLRRKGKLLDLFIIVHPPYGPRDKIYTTKVPPGVPVVDGPRSAYQTIRKITGGNLPEQLKIDMGIMDVSIKSDREIPRIKFVRDIEVIKRQHHTRAPHRVSAPRVKTAR
jgi:hypothetical protein